MDAIILAAGLGTRLRPHTLTTPKPLLPVRGRPILDWTLGALPRAVDRVIVVVNYLAEQVEEYLRGQAHFKEWATVRQAEPRGTGDALPADRQRRGVAEGAGRGPHRRHDALTATREASPPHVSRTARPGKAAVRVPGRRLRPARPRHVLHLRRGRYLQHDAVADPA